MIERYYQIGRINVKHNLLPHIIIGLALCLIAPFLMGVNNLNQYQSAQVLEMYVSLLGIVFLVPIFYLDQDANIREVVRAKYTPMIQHYLIRLFEAIILLVIFIMGFILFLHYGECDFPVGYFFMGTLAEAIFLGGLGVFIYGIVDNIVVGYMISMVYYMINFGCKPQMIPHFYLFTMMRGSYENKIYLGVGGVVLLVLGLVLREVRFRK
ncbi:hypothetical protein [Anaeromicropila herbilytica]|uniref:ABC transporter permease n=1 Tax=Anaeromicropila herbilytica TaxID=2785025 RepID=A0A7R7EJA2_9FIRM|nr:hypothetical protein [Anaeromicropila herbilytica]BCN29861.1 ABC transporter permease [Anaeromicropila herbilytica]